MDANATHVAAPSDDETAPYATADALETPNPRRRLDGDAP